MQSAELILYLSSRQEEMTKALDALVAYESPSRHKEKLDGLARSLAARYRSMGAKASIVADAHYGDHVVAIFSGAGTAASCRPALVLGHFDTVWPLGTVASRRFRTDAGKAWGPGVFDMKAGIILVEFALRAIHELRVDSWRPVIVFLCSDEEIGSPSSRFHVMEYGKQSEYALVLEPPLPGGVLKTARKGVGRLTLKIRGRASHAGLDAENGISAVKELAHQILHLESLNDFEKGTTVNVGVIRGGTGANVVPAYAEAEVNYRAWTVAEMERVWNAIRSSEPVIAGAKVEIEEGLSRPPMERTRKSVALFHRAQKIAADLGTELQEGSSGGGSDGNFCAAQGIPTLDGLGALGDGAHSEQEHVVLDSLPARAALLAALLLRL